MAIIVKSRDSLLTTSSGYTNYRGILNLVIILLVLSNARAALENVIKYGILVDPFSWILFLCEGPIHSPAILIILSQVIHISASLLIEKILAYLFKKELLTLNSSCELLTATSTTSNGNSNGNSNNNSNSKNNLFNGIISSTITKSRSPSHYQYKSQLMIMVNVILAINLISCLSVPPLIVYTNDTHPISTSVALMLVSIVFLKLVSYHMMNFWCRDLKRPLKVQSRTTKSFLRSYMPPAIDFSPVEQEQQPETATATTSTTTTTTTTSENTKSDNNNSDNNINNNNNNNNVNNKNNKHEHTTQVAIQILSKYPRNVTIMNMIQYMSFPTLCYELQYAQTERIRKRFLIKRIVELIILAQLDMALIQQWIVPTVSNSVTPFRQMKLSHMLERLLKLAIPNHIIWVIWFYSFFHSLLNIIAELTRFADREFYRDWWNSESVYYFWSNWNIPVHKWCARHLYVPTISLGMSKCQASTTVFFVSAFFHEYLVSVPLKMFRMWAFTGMLMQLPWARFVSSYFDNNSANVAVWVSLIIGQPLCILMYYHDYYVINNIQKSIVTIKPTTIM